MSMLATAALLLALAPAPKVTLPFIEDDLTLAGVARQVVIILVRTTACQ